MNSLKKITFLLFYLIAIALSIKGFREPDLWWQIRTGQWILQHHQVPHQDVFSYTMAGNQWINVKWGFEVLAALVSNTFGAESVFIIQAIVSCLLLFFLLKLSVLFFRRAFPGEDLNKNPFFLFSTTISLIVLFIGIEYRMNGRPEIFSHLMTIIFLYVLEKHRQSPSKQIFVLIPLQMLWANMHEAYGIGIIVLFIYTASSLLKELQSKRTETDKIKAPVSASRYAATKVLLLVTIASLAAIGINPNGAVLLLRPFNIAGQLYANKFTTELHNFIYPDWWQKEAWIGLALFGLTIVSSLIFTPDIIEKTGRRFTTRLRSIFKTLTSGYTLSIFLFFYLSLSAYRNLAFLSIVCFPLLQLLVFSSVRRQSVRMVPQSLKAGVKHPIQQKWLPAQFSLYSLGVLFLLSFYVLIVSNKYYTLTNSHDRFGLEVLSNFNPVGASDYIEKNHLQKKKCFSDYLTSSYLLWKLQPDFKTFIDLRDLDVFTKSQFSGFLDAVNYPNQFHRLDSTEHFDYAVISQRQFPNLHYYLFNDSLFALKYVDAVAAVYQKTDTFSREDIFSSCKPVSTGNVAIAINKTLNPFYKSFDYSSIDTNYIAANYYVVTNRLDLAMRRAQASINVDPRGSYKGYEMAGVIYHSYALQESSKDKKAEYLNTSEQYYMESLQIKGDYSPSMFGLAGVLYAKGNYTGALRYTQKSLGVDRNNADAELFAAECYKALLSTAQKDSTITPSQHTIDEYLHQLLMHYLAANSINPGNPEVEKNLGFIYYRMNDCKKAKEYLLAVADNRYLSEDDHAFVLKCMKSCGY